MHDDHAFHIENARLVAYLEARCRECRVEFTEGTVREVRRGEGGVEELVQVVQAHLFVRGAQRRLRGNRQHNRCNLIDRRDIEN